MKVKCFTRANYGFINVSQARKKKIDFLGLFPRIIRRVIPRGFPRVIPRGYSPGLFPELSCPRVK